MVVFILMALQFNQPPLNEKNYLVGVYATEAACQSQKIYWINWQKTYGHGEQILWSCQKWSVAE
jgi:hypothetical protein